MGHYHTWVQVQKALRKVLAIKTTPDVTQAILDDLYDELNKPRKESIY